MSHETAATKSSGFEGQHRILLPDKVITAALQQKPLLRGLLATGGGYFPKASGHLRRRESGFDQAVMIYCVKGSGWCEVAGHSQTVHAGELVALPPGVPHAYGANTSNPWTIHWVHAMGSHLPDYFKELDVTAQSPIVQVGEDLQLTLLFNEVVRNLERGVSFLHLLQASHTLAHLLALLIGHRYERQQTTSDAVQKVAQSIVFISEHLDQPPKVTALAALANLSPAHFTVLFKEQTGCSPRDYLHLLRMHKACQLLQNPSLNVKDIATKLGYQDQFHFSRQFKAFQGTSPSDYRENKSR